MSSSGKASGAASFPEGECGVICGVGLLVDLVDIRSAGITSLESV